jgi:selenophosphate synthetase-related protein
VDAYYVGKFAARVALLEVMASGARPIVISDGLCCEMAPTGLEIMRGIEDEAGICGNKDITLTGSTEENFPTSMTGIGLTVIGYAADSELRFWSGRPGDVILLAGSPAVGAGVNLDDDSCYKNLARLMRDDNVMEIVPVGSKGILYEAQLLAELNGCSFAPEDNDVDLLASAGPATCMIALCRHECAAVFADYPLIGRFI